MQGSLILNPLQVEDRMLRPVKWCDLKPNIPNTGQLQGHIYGFMCACAPSQTYYYKILMHKMQS